MPQRSTSLTTTERSTPVKRSATPSSPRNPAFSFITAAHPPMIQHVARGMFGAIIVDPKNAKAWPKADREYVLMQSEYFKNPDDVQAMFDRKFDGVMFNGGIFKYHPFVTGGGKLDAKPGERVRIYFVNAGPNEFSAFHPIGEIWDNVYESGNPANKLTGSKPTWWDRAARQCSMSSSNQPVPIRSSPTR